MKMRLLWLGRTKEQFIKEGIRKYLRLLMPFADVEVIEIREEKGKLLKMALDKEAERILKQTESFALLDVKGRQVSSEEFASFLKDKASIDFVMGGAYGVSGEVKKKARDILSLGAMTFTHEMTRLIVLEQIYRAMMINRKRGYHH